ncbi:alpha/beta hydrolase [Rhodococcus ruber]|uniref:Putative hydrolase or acyltransferase of alpha/beta superfamily n=3 Tax=Rhodococcus TaxID=1827 RepID=A0A098BW40_9NOCA|nr:MULTISPECIES: alpha/beta hydrolase [Rhodococcus]MDO2380503.1 alpha/beta hydrolase [Rhodococcus ruber]MBP2210763.1 pimeloyl-ACP methyl ester carboxylesterase [Rhodococcus ruber]MCD2127818.1 alpha/beta hydrolase [Rhodococcus ruber]MCZ1071596.1 alpha/beta hydrolase [Rhodococcus sp. A5(2022)]MCZ4504477.1 alpha/beta hydrolase [Rhodococcus ruber]
MIAAQEGAWDSGMPYLCAGTGPPLLFMPGLSTHHRLPRGFDRRTQLAQIAPWTTMRRVWWVNRRPGLPPGTTMADLARDYAVAMPGRFPGPVDVLGVSTGGSVALQLALDHPELVRRLVLVASAAHLGPGRDVQRRAAAAVRAGHPRRAMAELAATTGARRWSRALLWVLGWLLEPSGARHGYDDFLVVVDAEDRFDVTARLAEVTCPVLVLGGDRDGFYGADLFGEVAAAVPRGRAVVRPGVGHLGVMTGDRWVRDASSFLDTPDAPGFPETWQPPSVAAG